MSLSGIDLRAVAEALADAGVIERRRFPPAMSGYVLEERWTSKLARIQRELEAAGFRIVKAGEP